MADTKITGLTEDTAPAATDLLATVDDPGGTPITKKATIKNVVGYIVTTAGDVIYATASRTIARLGIGTAGQVLTVNAGATAPEWADATGGGGNTRVKVLQAMPPATTAATIDYRAGGSTPAEQVMVYDFVDASDTFMDFKCELGESYGGGGLTFSIKWSAETATSGAVVWGLAIRRVADDGEDIDTSHSYDYNEVTATTASASGEVDYATITFTDGADMDNLSAGEIFILRVRRNGDDGSDTMTDTAELWNVSGTET